MKRLAALLVCTAFAMTAIAEDSAKETFKKTEKGMGNLLQGMGQEIGKITDPKSAKKDGKSEKPKPKEPAK